MKKIFVLLSFALSFLGFSQENPEEIALANDAFQENFYEALKQKGIENHDKAILALDKCIALQPENPILYFEKGKNYFFQKNYTEAKANFEKATQLDQKNRWYLVGIYDVLMAQKNYTEAISIIKKLIPIKKEYQEELVSLYMFTAQYDDALKLIDELTATVGKSEAREQFRAQILTTTKYKNQDIEKLQEAIKQNPKEEKNYVALIYLYSENNQENKALEVAQLLEKNIPSSDWAQVSLFKFHLDKNEAEKAAFAMEKVFQSNKIDVKIKHRIVNEYLVYVQKNPSFSSYLDKALVFFKEGNTARTNLEIGKFYQAKKDYANASKYYEKAFQIDMSSLETRILYCYALAELKNYSVLALIAQESIDLYPLQPDFYFLAGVSFNEAKQFDKAKTVLETGLDYVVENNILELNFYTQMAICYKNLGDTKKENICLKKIDSLKKK